MADGTTAVLMTNSGLVLVEASSAAHAQLAAETVVGISDVALDASGAVWASTFDDGLAAWSARPATSRCPAQPASEPRRSTLASAPASPT